jgi:hypothetical protein
MSAAALVIKTAGARSHSLSSSADQPELGMNWLIDVKTAEVTWRRLTGEKFEYGWYVRSLKDAVVAHFKTLHKDRISKTSSSVKLEWRQCQCQATRSGQGAADPCQGRREIGGGGAGRPWKGTGRKLRVQTLTVVPRNVTRAGGLSEQPVAQKWKWRRQLYSDVRKRLLKRLRDVTSADGYRQVPRSVLLHTSPRQQESETTATTLCVMEQTGVGEGATEQTGGTKRFYFRHNGDIEAKRERNCTHFYNGLLFMKSAFHFRSIRGAAV